MRIARFDRAGVTRNARTPRRWYSLRPSIWQGSLCFVAFHLSSAMGADNRVATPSTNWLDRLGIVVEVGEQPTAQIARRPLIEIDLHIPRPATTRPPLNVADVSSPNELPSASHDVSSETAIEPQATRAGDELPPSTEAHEVGPSDRGPRHLPSGSVEETGEPTAARIPELEANASVESTNDRVATDRSEAFDDRVTSIMTSQADVDQRRGEFDDATDAWPTTDGEGLASEDAATDTSSSAVTPDAVADLDEIPADDTSPATRRPIPDPSILPIEEEEETHLPPKLRDAVGSQARTQIQQGIELAARGAMYSARTSFIKALRVVAQSLDAQSGNQRHSEALANGLRALDEASDFQPRGAELQANLDLAHLVATHSTPILHDLDVTRVTPLMAMQKYHAYAERQLAIAGGHELVAADAYFGLAKLQASLHPNDSAWPARQGPVAMSYYQAALMVYPDHYLAANELGVMFARYGQLREAREVLRHAAALQGSMPDIWHNLAKVHERLGETQLAELARREATKRSNVPTTARQPARNQVTWVAPEDFQAMNDSSIQESMTSVRNRSSDESSPLPSDATFAEATRNESTTAPAAEATRTKHSFWPFGTKGSNTATAASPRRSIWHR